MRKRCILPSRDDRVCQGAHGGAYSSNLDVRATEYDARKEKHAQVGVCARAEIPDMTP